MTLNTHPECHLRQSFDPLNRLRDPFLIPSKSRKYVHQQYSNVYYSRLARLRQDRLVRRCQDVWDAKTISRVLDIGPDRSSVVIGTVYCEMKLKPNVLHDLAREHHLGPGLGPRKWATSETEAEDSVMLEDESGRVRLVGVDKSKWTLVTGIVIGVRGRETNKGDFQVFDIIYAGTPPQTIQSSLETNQGLVGILSGLALDGIKFSRAGTRAEALVQWLNGEIGGPDEKALAKSVGRLIVAGNSVCSQTLPEFENHTAEEKKQKRHGYDSPANTSLPTDHLDEILSEVDVVVDLIPGPNDPAISTLPQQPLHRCLLPKTNCKKGDKTLTHGPNPWWAKIGGASFLGTSGQNIDDIYKYVVHEDRLKLAKQTLEWSHIAPTAPDTLWSYPFQDQDPFVLTELPNVYFVGNQPKFETELVTFSDDSGKEKKTRVILVPRFSRTGMLILVDPLTLKCQCIQFLKDTLTKDSNDSDVDEDENLTEGLVLDMDVDDEDE